MSATRDPRPPGRALRVAIAAVVVIALALTVVAVALAHVDAGFLKPRLEAAVLHATGRRLTLAGPIHLALFPAPGFVADDVTLANVAGGSRPAMLHADSVAATLDPSSLFGQLVSVRSLVLTDPDILLERTADGRPNWVFERPQPEAPARPGAPAAPGAHVRLTVSSLEMRGGRLAWSNLPGPGETLSGAVSIDRLLAQQHDDQSSFTLWLAGQHGAAHFALSLASAAPAAAAHASAAHPFPLRASLRIGDAGTGGPGSDAGGAPSSLNLDGQFTDPLHARGFTGTVHARLADLADLDLLFPHAGLPSVRSVRIAAALARDAAGGWSLGSLDAATGAADAGRLLTGLAVTRLSVVAHDAAAPIALHAAGTLRGQAFAVDAPALGSLAAWQTGGAAPVDLAAVLGRATAQLRGSVARGADRVTRLDAASTLAIPDTRALAAAFGRALDQTDTWSEQGRITVATGGATGDSAATVAADRLTFDGGALPASDYAVAHLASGDWHGTAALRGEKPWLTLDESHAAQQADTAAILDGHLVPAVLVQALLGKEQGITGDLDLSGRLTGVPLGGRLDPAHLSGTLSATLVDGTIGGEAAHALLGPALAATHLPLGAGSERVRCAGVVTSITNGVAAVSSLSLDSRLLAVDGAGTVDLATGTLALHLRPAVRIGVASASAPVLIGGTLDAPVASLAHDDHGRVALSFGRGAAPQTVACDANPDVAGLPVAKQPKAMDILRGLGLFR